MFDPDLLPSGELRFDLLHYKVQRGIGRLQGLVLGSAACSLYLGTFGWRTQWGDHVEFPRISRALMSYSAANLLLEAAVFLLANPHQVRKSQFYWLFLSFFFFNTAALAD